MTDIRQIIMNSFLIVGLFLFTVEFWFLRDQSSKFLIEMLPFGISKKKKKNFCTYEVCMYDVYVCFPYLMVENDVLVLSSFYIVNQTLTFLIETYTSNNANWDCVSK